VKLRQAFDPLYRRWQEVRRPRANEYHGVDSDGFYFVIDEENQQPLFVSHPRRLPYYRNGVQARISNLAREYCVSDLPLSPGDQIVDVGAHSGEFGMWARRFGVRYLAIEPDPIAFEALRRNMPECTLENLAVGAGPGVARFSLATSTGDSSFGSSGNSVVDVTVEKLDTVVERVFPSGRIAVLKIEAEGFEPEVLQGAGETLGRTDIVTVDAGEEREGSSTAPQCVNLLLHSGFRLRDVYLRRGVFLFESVKTS
jgi:FkbM family methyltransferase